VKTVFILGVNSDIGFALAKQYSKAGFRVMGTRNQDYAIKEFNALPNSQLFYLDIMEPYYTGKFLEEIKKLDFKWDVLISCIGNVKPIGSFFDLIPGEWKNGVELNATSLFSVLPGLCEKRNLYSSVFFLAGAGTNSALPNYSAYVVSKILLIKMCEQLDAETYLKVCVVGPGMVKTKGHQDTLEAGERAGHNFVKVKEFLETGEGTSMKKIFDCSRWCMMRGERKSWLIG